jgi:hypothetical protein
MKRPARLLAPALLALALAAVGCSAADDAAVPRGIGSSADPVWMPVAPGPVESPAGAVAGALTVSWSFPGLIGTAMGSTLPSYLAHLFGKQPRHPLDLHTACAAVTNPGAQAVRARLRVDLPVYAQPATADVTALPGRTTVACLDPTFDLARLYALHETTPGRLEVALTDAASGTELSAAMRPLSLVAPGEIAWAAAGVAAGDLRDLAAVFVTPKDPAVDRLQRLAQEHSAWNGFGGGDPYRRGPLLTEDTIAPGEYLLDEILVEADERLGWELLAGTDGPLGVYLFTPEQYQAWRTDSGHQAVQAWSQQGAGARGLLDAGGGAYLLVTFNPSDSARPVAVRAQRTATREEVARDVLASVYVTLAALGTRYSNISDTYFGGWQHVRRPPEVLQALSANCIDGALLFASVLELLGMEPVVVMTTGHAYAGVRSAPGSTVIWPVETTLLDSAGFADAYHTATAELLSDARKDPQFRLLDIKALRARGILPMPQ